MGLKTYSSLSFLFHSILHHCIACSIRDKDRAFEFFSLDFFIVEIYEGRSSVPSIALRIPTAHNFTRHQRARALENGGFFFAAERSH